MGELRSCRPGIYLSDHTYAGNRSVRCFFFSSIFVFFVNSCFCFLFLFPAVRPLLRKTYKNEDLSDVWIVSFRFVSLRFVFHFVSFFFILFRFVLFLVRFVSLRFIFVFVFVFSLPRRPSPPSEHCSRSFRFGSPGLCEEAWSSSGP